MRENSVGVDTVNTVADTLHHLAQSHGSTELQHPAELDLNQRGLTSSQTNQYSYLLSVGEARQEDLAAV